MHEAGHAVAGLISGARVQRIVWQLTAISRTDVSPNPHPLFVCWAGPLCGCLTPLLMLAAARRINRFAAPLQFFAGFCLCANGAYVGFGSLDRIGDAGTLLKLGAPAWLLWCAGGISITLGLWLWHQLGRIRQIRVFSVSRLMCAAQAIIFTLTVAVQILLFSR